MNEFSTNKLKINILLGIFCLIFLAAIFFAENIYQATICFGIASLFLVPLPFLIKRFKQIEAKYNIGSEQAEKEKRKALEDRGILLRQPQEISK